MDLRWTGTIERSSEMLHEELWCHADAGMLLHAAADLPELLQLVLKMGVDVNGGISDELPDGCKVSFVPLPGDAADTFEDRAEHVRASEVAHAFGHAQAVDLLAQHGAARRRQIIVNLSGLANLVLDADQRTIPRSLRAATSLSISEHGQSRLPVGLVLLQGLQQLTIERCSALQSLPAEVGQLQGLQQLTISDCSALQSLPAEVGQLQGLQQLTIERCSALQSLPAELQRFRCGVPSS